MNPVSTGFIREQDRSVPANDGLALEATLFFPPHRSTRSVNVAIIAGATGARRSRYARYARFLAEHGWVTISFDYRGIGGSRVVAESEVGYCMRDWGAKDLAGIIDWSERSLGALRICVVGHSVGGQIIAFARNHARLDAAILVGAQNGYWRLWDGVNRPILCALWHALPVVVSVFGCLPLKLVRAGEDVPAGIAREWGRWGRQFDFVDESGRSLSPEFSSFNAPILAYSFSDDTFYAPRRAVEALLAAYRNAPIKHRHLAPRDLDCRRIGHSGFFDGTMCTELWRESVSWLAQVRARTSGVRAVPV